MRPVTFDPVEPRLRLEDYFSGTTRAVGIFEDRFGRLRRQFQVDIAGHWDGRILNLDECFQYDDGETDQRIWTIEKVGEQAYEGRAADVIGVARGECRGNSLYWHYDIDLKMRGSALRVHFRDRMYLQPSGVLLNRARISKFGLEIGTVTISFHRPGVDCVRARRDVGAMLRATGR